MSAGWLASRARLSGQPCLACLVQIPEGRLVAHRRDVVIVDIETLEEGLGEQAPGRLAGLLEELLRLVEETQCSSQSGGTLGEGVLHRSQLATDTLLILLQRGQSTANLADRQRSFGG
jgi:hypothetical protein